MKDEKTNVTRLLDQAKIKYIVHSFHDRIITKGTDLAGAMAVDPEIMYKTLVTVGKSSQHYVFVVPVEKELDLKKAAKAVNEKSIEMIAQKDLLPLTGYVHGGCSPVGMKKKFITTIEESSLQKKTILVSAGKIGCSVELNPADLVRFVDAKTADLINERDDV